LTTIKPDDQTTAFFLESDSDQLAKIYWWARARFAAPWAVFFAVLLRVAASVKPNVQLPGIIGGRASLNLLCAFVSPSGGGKGISDKVGRLAWPVPIVELPIGSGEGIAETFTLRGKESEDNERITAAIFNCSEIDILTGLESRQGSTILGTLKAFAMGEQFGSTNASKANSRNVPAHSYRGCVSVGAQPGHTGVIFGDTSGGTPQRFLWALTIDPHMPATVTADPDPLDTTMPKWEPGPDGVVEIVYGPREITETIIAAHLARQRGEADALDGHAMLTRCKVAAIIAIMHGRSVVSQWDWDRSADVMAASDRTRDWIVDEAKKATRAKARERAIARAVGEEFYDHSRLETVKRSILRMLERDGEQAGNVLRMRLGRKEKRELFDQAISLLEEAGAVEPVPGLQKGTRYRLGGQGDHPGQGAYTQVNRPDHDGQGDHPVNVTDLDSRRSPELHQPKLTAPQVLENHLIQERAAGKTTTDSFAIQQAFMRHSHLSDQSRRQAIHANPDLKPARRQGGDVTYSIIPGQEVRCENTRTWIDDWLTANPPAGGVIDKAAMQADAKAADITWDAITKAARQHPRIDRRGKGANGGWHLLDDTADRAQDGETA
jgi:hypothetical protein